MCCCGGAIVVLAFLNPGVRAQVPPPAVRLAADTVRVTPAVEPAARPEVQAFLDQSLRAAWKAAGVTPSRAATDAEFCRRLYLDLLGRIPTVEELNAYLNENSRDRRAQLVSKLLSPEYAEDYTRNWTTIWSNLLIGRAAQGRPWIFREIAHYLATGERLPAPSPGDVRDLLLGHLDALHAFYGEALGVRIARKHLGWYARDRAENAAFRAVVNRAETAAEQCRLTREYFDRLAEALPVAA